MEIYDTNDKPKRTDRIRNKKLLLGNDFILLPPFWGSQCCGFRMNLQKISWDVNYSTSQQEKEQFASEGLDRAHAEALDTPE